MVSLPQVSRRLPPPLAYRELHERHGEAVRKRPQILPILQTDYFFAQGMCLHIFVGSFSVGLRRAKTTEICAKEGLCYAAFCIARFPARCSCSDLSLLRSSLPTESSMNGRERPCENSTTNTAILPLGYAFRQEYVLAPISGESFSAGLLPAKTTEVWAKWCPCYEAFCIARLTRLFAAFSLPRCLSSSLSASSLCLFSDLSLLRSGSSSDFSAIAFRLAYRELHEWRGEAVRKLDHRYCHIAVRLCF